MARLSLLTLLLHSALITAYDQLQYVDQLIGTANGGNVFGGASLPFGMAKAVADTNSQSNQGGFVTGDGSNITGFSSFHDSGTGGNPSLGDFQLFPFASCTNNTIDGCSFIKSQRTEPWVNNSLKASPGYFGLQLANSGIYVDMTVAAHTALYRFQFPQVGFVSNGSNPLVLLDLTDLQDSRQDNATISLDANTGRMQGGARFEPSFGSGTYLAYFCVDFSGSSILDAGIWVNSRGSDAVENLIISRGINSIPLPGGGFVRFENEHTILARVGLSFQSPEQACSAAESEIPNFNFNATHSAAVSAWRKAMSPITVSRNQVNSSMLKNFYSGVYRTMINPQNYTGFVPDTIAPGGATWFDSYYCLWDSFRSQFPFLTIIATPTMVDLINGLLNIYKAQGWLPDCHMSLCKGFTQGGSNADNIISDAYQKIGGTDIDWDLAYEAIIKDATLEPYDWCCEGRGGLDSWFRLGYIPVQDFDYKGFGTMTRSISRTLEYSYNDFCISRMAAGLGHTTDVETYQQQSENWLNLYKADQTSYLYNGTNTGFTGFFQAKYLNGTWEYQNPLKCSNIDNNPNDVCSLQNNGSETFESSIWEYGFFVPGDQAKLISTYGGPAQYVARLQYLHDNQITYIGNEPAFLTVFQYHYAGRPGLSAYRSHYYIPSYFSPTNGGLPGNDDSGAMGSFVALSMMGLFPNPGQDVYLITPPYFQSVNITSPVTGKVARIVNVGFDSTYNNIYIQRATLDGAEYTKNWIGHDFFLQGMELVLYLGPKESSWGTAIADLPPSLSPYEGFPKNGSLPSNYSVSMGTKLRF